MHRIEMNVATGKQTIVQYTAAEEEEHARKVAAKAIKDAVESEHQLILGRILALETPTGFTRRQREFMLENSADDSVKTVLASVDADITKLRAKLK